MIHYRDALTSSHSFSFSLCGQGSSIVVKEKKTSLTTRTSGFGKKKKKNPKPKYGPCNRNDVMEGCGTTYHDSTDVKEDVNVNVNVKVGTQKTSARRPKVKNTCKNCKDKQVLIQRNGRTAHADCESGTCFIGGDMLHGDIGDPCSVKGDDCDKNLVCVADSKGKSGRSSKSGASSTTSGTCKSVDVSMTDVVVARNARGGYCNLDKGWDACDTGMYCKVDGVDGIALRSGRDGGHVGGCGGAASGTSGESFDSCPALKFPS